MKTVSEYLRSKAGHGSSRKKLLLPILLVGVFCLYFLCSQAAIAEEPPFVTPVPTLSGLAKNIHLVVIAVAGWLVMRREKRGISKK